MKQDKQKVPFDVIALTILIVISVILLIPLLKQGFPITDDGNWMIIRLSAFFQNFRE